jgi:hypothetical protein
MTKRIAVLIAVVAALMPQTARADTSVDCHHPGSAWVGPVIFPPIACRGFLGAGTYHLSLDWLPPTSGFVVLSVGDDNGTDVVYFNTTVDAGVVTGYETDSQETSPPAKPGPLGPIAGDFTLATSGGLIMSVFPIQVFVPGAPGVNVPLGDFHLTVTTV